MDAETIKETHCAGCVLRGDIFCPERHGEACDDLARAIETASAVNLNDVRDTINESICN